VEEAPQAGVQDQHEAEGVGVAEAPVKLDRLVDAQQMVVDVLEVVTVLLVEQALGGRPDCPAVACQRWRNGWALGSGCRLLGGHERRFIVVAAR
jgi:hypothetical protein